jgi:hypothetical protein
MDSDEGEVAKNTLLNIGRDLIKNGYNVFLSEQEKYERRLYSINRTAHFK